MTTAVFTQNHHIDYGHYNCLPQTSLNIKNDGQPLTLSNFTTLQVISTIATLLENIIIETDYKQVGAAPLTSSSTHFNAKTKPKISIFDYLERVQKFSQCSQECYILALIYIDRIAEKHAHFMLNSLNIHSIMIAAKFVDDKFYNNQFYSRIGGITIQEINILEKEFLSLLNYQLFVSTSHFNQYHEKIFSIHKEKFQTSSQKDKKDLKDEEEQHKKEEPKPEKAEIAEEP